MCFMLTEICVQLNCIHGMCPTHLLALEQTHNLTASLGHSHAIHSFECAVGSLLK